MSLATNQFERLYYSWSNVQGWAMDGTGASRTFYLSDMIAVRQWGGQREGGQAGGARQFE